MLLRKVNSERPKLTLGGKFLVTLDQRCFTPFLLYLSTTCGVILINEAQFVEYVVFGEKDGKQLFLVH